MELEKYVGRSFVLQRTRYGALDGLIGKVTRIDRVPCGVEPTFPNGLVFKDVLVVETQSSDFPSAIAMPINLGPEVSTK
jgi:hypothetical protein